MNLTTKQIKQLIKEELENLLSEGNFEKWPEKLQKVYKDLWEDSVLDAQKTWEQTTYDVLLKDESFFKQDIKTDLKIKDAEDFFDYQFGDPAGRIVMKLTASLWDEIKEEEILDLLYEEWNSAVDYFEKTEEAREVTEYMRRLVDFAWIVASGELPASLGKLDELARSSVEGMLQAYGLYESLY